VTVVKEALLSFIMLQVSFLFINSLLLNVRLGGKSNFSLGWSDDPKPLQQKSTQHVSYNQSQQNSSGFQSSYGNQNQGYPNKPSNNAGNYGQNESPSKTSVKVSNI